MPSVDFTRLSDGADVRRAGREALSLALIEARNRLLAAANAIEAASGATPGRATPREGVDPPRWTLGHVGWYQEHWIARNVQRHRGPAADPTHPRLASVEREADDWYDPGRVAPADRWRLALPEPGAIRNYLADTLDVTLELLAGTAEDEASLYFYRRALMHEEQQVESLAVAAQTLGLAAPHLREPPLVAPRDPLLFPATRWRLGREPGGFAFDNEKWAHEVTVPEFEIDAQPVSWEQYAEFVEDGGYDEPRWWSTAGWAWVQREGRRAPRHVEQVRHGVLAQRFGRSVRVPLQRPVAHVTVHEAEAWCRWAGRRLPTEVEWELAAHLGLPRGFRWGQVWEWTGTTFGPYPGFAADPDRAYSQAGFGTHRVVRGASFATPPPLRHPKFRHFLSAERDDGFIGFRSCAR